MQSLNIAVSTDDQLAADGGSTRLNHGEEIFFKKGSYIVRYPRDIQEIVDLNEPIIVNQLDDPIPQSFGIDFATQTKMNDIIRQDVFDNNGIFFVEDTQVPLPSSNDQDDDDEEFDDFNDGSSGSTALKNKPVINQSESRFCKQISAMFMMFDMDKPIGYVPDLNPAYCSIKIPLIDATNKAKAAYPEFFTPEVKKARVRLIIVLREHRGKGLLNLIFEACTQMAKERGFDCIHMTSTSPETMHVARKFGYTVLSEVYFKDYPEINEHYKPHESLLKKLGDAPHTVQYCAKFL
eukprot:403364072